VDAVRQEPLQLHQFEGTVGVGFSPHAAHAVAQTALQRAYVLPLQPINRVAVRMGPGNQGAAQGLASVIVVALDTGQIKLTDTLQITLLAARQRRCQPRICDRPYRHAARLKVNITLQPQQAGTLQREGRRLLVRNCSRTSRQRGTCSGLYLLLVITSARLGKCQDCQVSDQLSRWVRRLLTFKVK
jgi:hypothetical protein